MKRFCLFLSLLVLCGSASLQTVSAAPNDNSVFSQQIIPLDCYDQVVTTGVSNINQITPLDCERIMAAYYASLQPKPQPTPPETSSLNGTSPSHITAWLTAPNTGVQKIIASPTGIILALLIGAIIVSLYRRKRQKKS
jgi:LPXTG-motif cell wall-anchored protein